MFRPAPNIKAKKVPGPCPPPGQWMELDIIGWGKYLRTISHLLHPGQCPATDTAWYKAGAPPSLASYYLPFWCVHNFGARWAEIKSLSLGLPTYWNLSIMFYITIPSTSQEPGARSQLNIKPNKRGICVVMEGEIVSGRNWGNSSFRHFKQHLQIIIVQKSPPVSSIFNLAFVENAIMLLHIV